MNRSNWLGFGFVLALVACGGETDSGDDSGTQTGSGGSTVTGVNGSAGSGGAGTGSGGTGTKTAASGSTGGSSSSYGSTVIGSTGGAAGAASTTTECTTLVQDGAAITPQLLAEAAPTPLGGTVTPGTYALSAWIDYVGTSGSTVADEEVTHAYVLKLTGTGNSFAFETVYASVSITYDSTESLEVSGTLTYSGNTYATALLCPEVETGASGTYTATSTTYTMYRTRTDSSLNTITTAYVFTLR